MRAGNIERPAAARAQGASLFNFAQAAGALVAERTAAAAFGAEPRITVYELAAMDARLLVNSHGASLPKFNCRYYNKISAYKNQSYRAFAFLFISAAIPEKSLHAMPWFHMTNIYIIRY